jgi:hypothetical protein
VTGRIRKRTGGGGSSVTILKAMAVFAAAQTLLHSYSTLNQ